MKKGRLIRLIIKLFGVDSMYESSTECVAGAESEFGAAQAVTN